MKLLISKRSTSLAPVDIVTATEASFGITSCHEKGMFCGRQEDKASTILGSLSAPLVLNISITQNR